MRPPGNKTKLILVYTGLFLFLSLAQAQDKVLDADIRIGGNAVRTLKVLEEICSQTGYTFTYDTKVVDIEERVDLPPKSSSVKGLLDSITSRQSLKYSIIGKHIVLYRDEIPSIIDSSPAPILKDITIRGKVADQKTREPLSYASIGIQRKARGTITNNDGDFVLKLPRECIEDTLMISYVGYSSRLVTVRSMVENSMVITLEQSFISIPEIIIKAQEPVIIIRKALARISENYGTNPAILTGFYREGIFRREMPQIYSEAVIQVYKSAYTRALQNDQIKVLQSRKVENIDMRDTLAVRLRAGLNSILALDGVKNVFDFTDPSQMSNYIYHIRDMVYIDGEKAYVISFEQKPEIREPLYKGDIYINSEDYGIIMTEFEISPELIHLTKQSYISKLPPGYSIKPLSVHYRVRYRKVNERYFLSHVRGDLVFAARHRRSLFNSRFKVFLEVAYTDYTTEDVKRFDRDETVPPYSIFTLTINGYDSEFWKDFNFLKPEDEISDEMDELKARMKISNQN